MKFLTQIALFLLFSTNLLAQENNSILCSDNIDNDGDGLIDCMDPDCDQLPNKGCATCTEGITFADTLIEYFPGCDNNKDTGPEKTLGVSDNRAIFLGQGGFIKLGFTNNLLTNSGDTSKDVYIFEQGGRVEASDIALKPKDVFTKIQLQNLEIPDANEDGYYEIGRIKGSTRGFDIDAKLPGFMAGKLIFDAIEVKDVIDGSCSQSYPGADIDAVCALSSSPVLSVIEEKDNETIRLFPNPTKDKFSVLINNNIASSISYEIISINGQSVKKGKLHRNGKVDLSNLPNDLYFVKLSSLDDVIFKKIVKM